MKGWILVAGVAIILLTALVTRIPTVPTSAAGIGDVLSQGAEAKDGPLAKVGGDLADLYQQYQAYRDQRGAEGFSVTNPLLLVANGSVVIDAVASGDALTLQGDLEALGMQNTARYGAIVSGRLPIASIGALASLDNLQFARPGYPMLHAGSVDSQGDAATGADQARALFGVDGTGVTVGVISDSYDCLGGAAGDIATGDLPSGGVNVLEEASPCAGDADEGRAMLQIVHDVAPGAALAFGAAFNSGSAGTAQNVLGLASGGAGVIVDDIGWLTAPMFQDGIIAQAVDTVVGQGVAYFSSAGNAGRDSYEAAFAPGPMFDGAGTAHDFGGGDIFQRITIPEDNDIRISFQWDSPYFSVSGGAGSPNDLDIYLLSDPPTTILAGSTDNNIGGDPVELLGFSNPAGSGATEFNLVITKFAGPDPGFMKYIVFGPGSIGEFDTASSTLFGHPNAAGAEAVGAAFYGYTPAFGVDPPLLEYFSSAGPTPILFEVDGTPTTEYRQKPEIVAPDGTNTTFFTSVDVEPDGFPNFSGTSAAAPHAAAVAALLLEADPTLTPAALYAALESTAVDMGTPGFDFDSGFGLVRAPMAVAAVSQQPVADLSVTKTDSPDPVTSLGTLTYTITVSNNGPADATGVTLTDNLPADAPYVSATPIQGACGEANGVATCDLGTLTNGAAATVTIVVTAPGPRLMSNTAVVAANEIDPDPSNNTAVETTQANPPPVTIPGMSGLGMMGMALLLGVAIYLGLRGRRTALSGSRRRP